MTQTYILDGFLGSHRRWEGLRRRLEREVGPSQIWHYKNSGHASIEEESSRLVEELRRLDAPFHLVGYSMGGIVAREVMRQAPELPLRRAALLHSPHQGTLLAHLLPLAALREMRPGSSFFRRLDESAWPHPTLVTWCAADLMVVPGVSARWKHATESVQSPVPAHAWPIFSRGIHTRVARFLAATENEPQRANC